MYKLMFKFLCCIHNPNAFSQEPLGNKAPLSVEGVHYEMPKPYGMRFSAHLGGLFKLDFLDPPNSIPWCHTTNQRAKSWQFYLVLVTLFSVQAVVVEGDVWGVTMAHMVLHHPNDLAEPLGASVNRVVSIVTEEVIGFPIKNKAGIGDSVGYTPNRRSE